MGARISHEKDGIEAHKSVRGALGRVENRMGRLPVLTRYHRLPRRLEDDFQIERGDKLGSGYSGCVVSATGKHCGRKLAVKSFKLSGITPTQKADLASELEVYLSMDHPHVCRLMEVYESDKDVNIVMECCEGGELYGRVAEKKTFSEKEAAETTWQMLLAVNYIHAEGVVHRDLKLENWMYEEQGSNFVKLIDFGFSTFFDKDSRMEESLGTISYVAPEVINKDYSCGSCDMWSLGVMVFVLLSGYMPFHGNDNRAIVQAIRHGRYTMRDSRWGHLSDDAADFVQRLLIVQPTKRLTAVQALGHPWISTSRSSHAVAFRKEEPVIGEDSVGEAFVNFAHASPFHQVCLRMMAWTLPREERRRLRAAFLQMDRGLTGVIKLDTLECTLRDQCGVSDDDAALVLAVFSGLDVDQDGDLHYSDFLAALMSEGLADKRDSVRDTFRKFDTSGAGYLTTDGIQEALHNEISKTDIEWFMLEADSDGDGRVDIDDFVRYVAKCEGTPRAGGGKIWHQRRRHIRTSFARAFGKLLNRRCGGC